MRTHRIVLTLIAAAALAAGSAGVSLAQKNGVNRTPGALARVPPARDGADWHHGGFRGSGWGIPGIIVGIPGTITPADPAIDDATFVSRQRQRSAHRRTRGVPPIGERRYVPDEVVLELANTVSERQVEALQRRHRLARIESQRSTLSGTTLFRWRILDNRPVPAVVRALERDTMVVSAQPNYLFALQAEAGSPAEGDPAQYALAKLHVPQAHATARGSGVRVAIIDSQVDAHNPELSGSIVATFDALPAPATSHAHGTAIAGVIAAHGRLMGVAPEARLLAAHAFDPQADGARATTFSILKSLDWAVDNGARIINMSFAGPFDPAIHHNLAVAHKKGIVLIAAAGNAGATSPPLFPASDPDVIAVTATDSNDRLFERANRGSHVAIAAPGVDILVPTPGGYEVASGTSYAAAEVSGIAALMLERDPALTPDRVRRALETSAVDLGPKGRDPMFGYGLADADAALRVGASPIAANAAWR
ncbi:MAG: S8 family serine peptidase [Pseudolabrys sp.]|nr:S8 family serine peptidase [Pseudolabrys sp.]